MKTVIPEIPFGFELLPLKWLVKNPLPHDQVGRIISANDISAVAEDGALGSYKVFLPLRS